MKSIIYSLCLTLSASSTLCVFGQDTKSEFIDIGDNHERIRKVFSESSTVNVLLKSFQQPEGVMKWLYGVLGEGNASFVVFNIANISSHKTFIENCEKFQSDPSIRIVYHERVLKETYSKTFEGFHSSQIANNSTPDNKKIPERFAQGLDKWRTFKQSGYIIFTSLEDLETLIGCLFNRYGSFLFIIDREVKNSDYLKFLDDIFHKVWKDFGNFKIFVLIKKELLTFNPFKKTGKGFGSIKTFTNFYTDEDLKVINGYPLLVEIFWSVFSIELGKKFSGPDVEVMNLLIKKLNSTCE